MRDFQKSIIKVIFFIFLISVLWSPAETEAGSIFDFFRRRKESVATEKAGKEDVGKGIAKEEPLVLPQVYKVKEGDSLSGIAKRFYGEVSKWALIYEANKDKIKDPNRIELGIELTIPAPQKEKVELSQIEAFYQQAKENFNQGDYPAAIVKFNQVVELEEDIYPIYTASAQEYIQQAQEKINEKEKRQIQAQREQEEELARQKEEKIKRLQKAQQQKEEIERRAKIENLYSIGKKYYQNKDYPDAACAFGEILTLEPEDKNALRYYEKCQQEIKREEAAQLLARRQEQLLRQKQKQPDSAREAQEKTKISQVESYYQQGKENIAQGDYLAAIVKFNQVIELEKGLYPTYTPYAQEYIQQAQEIIKEQEDKQIQAQKEADEERKTKQKELAKRTEEERFRKETEEKEKLAQIESAYKEAQETFLEAKAKFEKVTELEKDLGVTSTTRAKEFGDYLAQKEERLAEPEGEKKGVEEKEVLVQEKEALAHKSNVIKEEPQVLEYTISEADVLYVHIWEEETLSQEVIVRPDGKISFPLAGDVPVAGLTFTQLKEELTKRLKDYVKYPVVSISLKKLGGKKVIVLGEVNRAGVYSIAGRSTVLEAIGSAGGFTPDAVLSSVILIRGGFKSPQGKRINLSRAIDKADMGQNVTLQPEDVIYVPKKFIANVNYVLGQILGPLAQGSSTAVNIQYLED